MFRTFLCLFGVILALPILLLIGLAFRLPITASGIGYLLGCSLAVSGLIMAPWGGKYSLVMILTGVTAIVLVAGARFGLAGRDQNSNLRMITLPQGKATRWINTLIDEQDSVIFGEALFSRIGGDTPNEHEGITTALHGAYSKIRAIHSVFPSPVISTYLNFQRPAAFDAIIIEPQAKRHPETAIVFLHGYMGNVTAQCWEIAQGVEKFGAVTVCPSTSWTGQWWQPEGQAILQATFQYLRQQGIQKFYVGGFSNGGFGISRLAPKLSKENGLSGFFFIDGISDGPGIRESGLPILIIQGAQDERVPATGTRQIAEIIGDLATYVELDGDHFIIMKQPEPVQNAIADWLESHAR